MVGISARLLFVLPAYLAATAADAVAPPPSGIAASSIRFVQGAPRTVVLPGNEVASQRVATDQTGLLQVLFTDGTALTLGPNSEIMIDSFVFDPAAGTARLTATLTRGVFRYIGGRTAKTPEGVALSTAHGTLRIDNAAADISLGYNGEPPHFDMVFGKRMTLSRDGTVLVEVHRRGYSIVPEAGGASVRKTPAEWRVGMQKQLSERSIAEPHLRLAASIGHDERPSRPVMPICYAEECPNGAGEST